MADIQLNGQSITTTTATTVPAPLTFETWTVTALAALIPTLLAGQTLALIDASAGATGTQQAEVIRVTAAIAGATSITVQRGCDSTTPVAHANPSTFNIVIVASSVQDNGAELAFVQNSTGTATTVSGASLTYFLITGTGLTVPISARPVNLMWDGSMAFTTTVAPGLLFLTVQETTSGTGAVALGAGASSTRSGLPSNSGAWSKGLGNCPGFYRLGPTTTVRTFSLYSTMLWDSATGVFTVANSAASPTWFRAVLA